MQRILSRAGSLQKHSVLKVLLPAGIIISWEIIAIVLNNPFILPRLESVIVVMLNPTVDILGNGNLIDNAVISLERVVAGFFVAAVLAIPLGIGMAIFVTIHDLFDSVMQAAAPHPPACLGAFFPILLNTLDGVKGVKKTWIEAADIGGT